MNEPELRWYEYVVHFFDGTSPVDSYQVGEKEQATSLEEAARRILGVVLAGTKKLRKEKPEIRVGVDVRRADGEGGWGRVVPQKVEHLLRGEQTFGRINL